MASILVVEDEAMVAALIEDILTDAGHTVAAFASTMEEGARLAATAAFDLALLDRNLRGAAADPIADVLEGRGLPYLFMSGYGAHDLRNYRGAPLLGKPIRAEVLLATIAGMLRKAG